MDNSVVMNAVLRADDKSTDVELSITYGNRCHGRVWLSLEQAVTWHGRLGEAIETIRRSADSRTGQAETPVQESGT